MTQFDDVLPQVGDSGRYQIAFAIVMAFGLFFAGFQTLSVVFTTARTDFWCSDINRTTVRNWTDWINKCDVVSPLTNQTCQSWDFARDGDFESTWVSEFSLVCRRENLVQIASSIYMFGLLFGSTGYGVVSDKFGRVTAACICVVNTWVAGLSLALSPNNYVYSALRFVSGVGASGIVSVCFAFAAESVTSKYRVLWVLLVNMGWHTALCTLTGIAYAVNTSWQLELVLAAPSIILIPIVLLFGESPRWLLAKNRPEEAIKRCLRIARVNGKTPSSTFESDMRAVSDTLIKQQGENPSLSIFDVLRSPNMRRPTLLVWNNYFCSSLVYYGLLLATGDLAGNIFINFLLSSFMGLPAAVFVIIATRFIGRPVLFLVIYFACSACMWFVVFAAENPDLQTAVTVVSITGVFFASASFALSWAYAGELFPTLVRTTGMGSASTISRIGGILAPLLNILRGVWLQLPFIILATLSLVTSLLALLLPETKGVRLPESLEDADEDYVRPKLMRILRKYPQVSPTIELPMTSTKEAVGAEPDAKAEK